MKNMHDYKLSEFNTEDIKKAKEYVKLALLGFMTSTIENKIDDIFKNLWKTSFRGDDIFSFCFNIETKGNDLLAAIGAACNEREKE